MLSRPWKNNRQTINTYVYVYACDRVVLPGFLKKGGKQQACIWDFDVWVLFPFPHKQTIDKGGTWPLWLPPLKYAT